MLSCFSHVWLCATLWTVFMKCDGEREEKSRGEKKKKENLTRGSNNRSEKNQNQGRTWKEKKTEVDKRNKRADSFQCMKNPLQ